MKAGFLKWTLGGIAAALIVTANGCGKSAS
jgi:hypothetical protein